MGKEGRKRNAEEKEIEGRETGRLGNRKAMKN